MNFEIGETIVFVKRPPKPILQIKFRKGRFRFRLFRELRSKYVVGSVHPGTAVLTRPEWW